MRTEDYSAEVCGVAKVGGVFKSIIINDKANFQNKKIKDIIYSTEFDEVESLFGFTDLDIIEIKESSQEVHNARVYLREDEEAQAVVFLRNGFLIITDLVFFTAYTRIGDVETPYSTTVETDLYEDEEAAEMIANDYRLS